ncbi:MAG: hypothetical protein ACJA07_001525 [Rhodococcus sp. (in: high G+C Gram-positive bacteria)]|jgi:hypothetical protein
MIGRTRRVVASAVFAVGLTAAGIGAAAPAHAYPAQCDYGIGSTGTVSAWCSQGSGEVKAVAGCKNVFGFWTNSSGPWVNIKNGASHTSCPFGYSLQWGGFNLR